jgi:EAL domain-containing protein (putative c-di-GMP-specific phosphodiesterase class I)/FixJ family two-component response regulator
METSDQLLESVPRDRPAVTVASGDRIIVVDDDPLQCKLVSCQLEQLGFTPYAVCTSACEALGVLDECLPGRWLVLLDLHMPDMDGVELLRHLGGYHQTTELVLMSGAGERVVDSVARLASMHKLRVIGCCAKPVMADQLQAALAHWQSGFSNCPKSPRKVYNRAQVRRALDEQEFTNFYQPKVDVATGAVVGVEALVRWQNPADGLVMPDQFIGVAEESDLIDDLTHCVIARALHDAKTWRNQGLLLPVAINVSMDNLVSLDFPDLVSTELDRSNLAATDITLEITESRLMTSPKESLEILARLSLKNVGLSIDDFGTGHSSLAQLRDIPFNELKIDRGFVHGACRTASLRGIFEGCLQMARTLGMKVVAEGVEDEEDWTFLGQNNCDYAQGYFIARPMPAEEIGEWLAHWKARTPALLAD